MTTSQIHTPQGRALEDVAIMRRLTGEINDLAQRHPVSSAALLLEIRADQVQRFVRDDDTATLANRLDPDYTR